MTAPANNPSMSLQIDTDAGAAYLRLNTNAVARTVEFNDDIMVDLDELDVVVGIELLDLAVSVPLDDVAQRFHISGPAMDLLTASIKTAPPTGHVVGAAPCVQRRTFSAGTPSRC